ncbi:fasciclin-like arabinogalactan protein 1 [Impatiens glandulifera]|uniref:fasciclin-like arabinogalactan protein 1 n=1 Tax=Impatiens glandulifera TaxID=253017 RepID=UPI001FB05539|nr:fasciclin-like arabinogalactan protein 1 [Impatiens glandulifera]
MQVVPTAGAGPTVAMVVVLVLILLSSSSSEANNVTKILDKFPQFSTFNHYLTVTHLADDINDRQTITVCAVDNAAMSDLLAKHLSIDSIKNVLSFHVILDYFGAEKLHKITNSTVLSATMFQATGSASGSSGFVNITDLKGGKVAFSPEGNDISAFYVKILQEIPYNISVIQISNILTSPEAEAPTPAPTQINLTSVMSAHGCKAFADALIAEPDAEKMFADNIEGGLTVFCPADDAFKNFLPKYHNLSEDHKQSLLEFHGVPVFLTMPNIKSDNGLMNTLATDGANKFDFEVQNVGQDVTLKTKVVTAKITGTLVQKRPLAIYTINKVLQPMELFNVTLSPAPAPEPVAEAPKKAKKGKNKSPPATDSPAASPDEDPADQTADKNVAAVRSFGGVRFIAGILGLWLANLSLYI